MRKGPHPLSVQIGLAASAAPIGGNPGQEFLLRSAQEITGDLAKMLLGIQTYQKHPYKVKRPKLETVWEAGAVTLNAIPEHAAKPDAPVIVLVPSMVNRGYILDLMPERSMMRWLAGQGITPYLLDWGEGVEDEGQQSINDIVMERLVPAINFAAQKHAQKVNVLGYCMGGTLVAGAAQNAAHNIASVIYLAAPWDFHAGTKNMLSRVKFWAPSAFPAIDLKGHLPMDWMQMLFASMDPKSAAKKFAKFAAMDQESEEAELFVAVEDWLNDGVDLPGPVAQACIKEWFFENAPAEGKWKVGGKAVLPAKLKMPMLVITSKRDRLVDFDTAVAISGGKAAKGTKIINTGTGHIGMIAGSAAVKKVWQPIADFIKKNSP